MSVAVRATMMRVVAPWESWMSQMTTTARLLRVFRVDEQLKGLESRLRAAERFLKDQ